MTETQILIIVVCYFLALLFIGLITGRKTDSKTFFLGSKKSPWFLVAFGMIGASLSGVTFISVPGWVGTSQFAYMQIVFGYMLGYLTIALVLMPIYYKLNVTTIYGYLENRFGLFSYKTGAFYFLLSKVVGAGFRLFLVASVLQLFIFNALGISFTVTVAITLGLILIYTMRGGIRTIVFTDTLQTFFMLLALVLAIVLISRELELTFTGMVSTIVHSEYSKIFVWDWNHRDFFLKNFVGGAFIAMTMTGLDQDMMQKNLSIARLDKAQKNIYWQMGMYLATNLIFLSMGVLLYLFAVHQFNISIGDPGIVPAGAMYPNEALKFLGDEAGLMGFADQHGQFRSDFVFPTLALKYLPPIIGVVFVIGLIAAAYSSADSALTALTTSFCVDFLNFEKGKENLHIRYAVHISFAFILLITILLFNLDRSGAVIDRIFTAAGYTYGPLLGLFSFGILTRRDVRDRLVPLICIISPAIIYLIKIYEQSLFGDFVIGHELILYNGLITFGGLLLISKKKDNGDTKKI